MQSRLLLGASVLLLAGVLLAVARLGGERTSSGAVPPTARFPAARPEGGENRLATPPTAEPDSEPRTAEVPAPAGQALILCLTAEEHTPLSGARAYDRARPLGRASDEDGVLRFERGEARAFSIWCPGRVPVRVRAFEPTPERVLLASATGRIEVHVDGLAVDERIARTLLQPHDFTVGEDDPWRPRLLGGPGLLSATELPPGTYDVYVWVADESGESRPLAAPGIAVEGGATAVVRLDANVPPPREVDG